ncbi:AMP-binding protein [Sulfidibacter corallicola]|uniref:AMP-binding protein n=1 Tax=Sulfidibacter corallicola TaxID=2818388 RepID=A0A8A4TMF0_SULCO|nr:condensation domain-containing protein [Sulfidibacter corallicola]QTD50061.1 AMP-binding protein [Sulfidibacter corallicola]
MLPQATVIDLLIERAEKHPDDLLFSWIDDNGDLEEQWTAAELLARVEALSGYLHQKCRLKPGEPVVLAYPPGLEFVTAFLGCMYAGALPIPCYPPDPMRPKSREALGFRQVVEDCEARIALTEDRYNRVRRLARVRNMLIKGGMPALEWVCTNKVGSKGWRPYRGEVGANEPAFLQYTSGSTSAPKGVAISHENVLHQAAFNAEALGLDRFCKAFIWVPQYHDFGLISGILNGVCGNGHVFMMSPFSFIRRPHLWLEVISRLRISHTCSPDFGFALAVRKTSEAQRQKLDLSCLKVALSAAEPIRLATVDAFCEAFGPHGFRREAFWPGYGLAEHTVGITIGGRHTARVDRAALEQRGRFVPSTAEDAVVQIGCGRVPPDVDLRIVDPATCTEVAEGTVGEIWVDSPSKALGYYRKEAATEETFRAKLLRSARTYLRTGDLGVLYQGELYVTGRFKDVIIQHGRNIYAQDVEEVARHAHPSIRPGGLAAFGYRGQAGAVQSTFEHLMVVVELESEVAASDWGAVADAVQRAVLAQLQLPCRGVIVGRRGAVLKTTSGKVQRRACRAAFESDKAYPNLLNVKWFDDGKEDGFEPAGTVGTHSGEDDAGDDFQPPRNRVERQLCEIWQDVLEIDRVGIHDNFFHLGGHSLLANAIAGRIAETWGVHLGLPVLFESQTVAALAEALTENGTQTRVPIQPVPRDRFLPLSPAQERLWVLTEIEAAGAAYVIDAAFDLRGPLQVRALERAVQGLVQRHESLRTVVGTDDEDQPVQVIRSVAKAPWDMVDLSHLGEVDRERAWRERMTRDGEHHFDLRRDTMVRACLFRFGEAHYLLALAFHHFAVDGWSMEVLASELGQLYGAYAQGVAHSLAPLAIQYADYAVWRRQRQAEASNEAGRAFWRNQLAGIPACHNLPSDRPRPAVQSYRGAVFRSRIDRATVAELDAICRGAEATLFMGLHTIFAALLARLSGERDIVVGTPVANREQPELAQVVGFFVNTLVLRTSVDNRSGFLDQLAACRETALDAFAHQRVTFDEVVDLVQPERSLSHAPLFQILMTLNRETALPALPGLEVTQVPSEVRHAHYDLSLDIHEGPDGLALAWTYNPDLFYPGTIARWSRHFETLMDAVIREPRRTLGQLSLLDLEQGRQLIQWQGSRQSAGTRDFIHRRFEARARQFPSRIALQDGSEAWRYDDLDERANSQAHYLIAQGVGPETRVGICLPRSSRQLVAVLAVLKAGATYVPLDPSLPANRLAYMIEDARLGTVLTTARLARWLDLSSDAWIDLDDSEVIDTLEVGPTHAPDRTDLTLRHAAYMLYTSGSTGNPKAVVIEHGSVAHFFDALDRELRVGGARRQEETWLATTSVGFDIAIFETLWNLTRGCRVILQPEHEEMDSTGQAPHAPVSTSSTMRCDGTSLSRNSSSVALLDEPSAPEIHDQILRHQVTHLQMTPAHVQAILESADGRRALGALRQIVIGGEAWSASLAAALREAGIPSILNAYGPTEATVWAAFQEIEQDRVVIGLPLANTEFHVLDDALNPVPVGVPGQLYIGGLGLARGYYHRPALTAAAFVPHPYATAPGERLYATGDLVRRDPDGRLVFLGRLDHQVKIRGFRIELGEIEAALLETEGTAAACVVVHSRARDDKHLVAYVVPEHGDAGEEAAWLETVRTALAARLPAYMVPSLWVPIASLPKNANGKVDRKALPDPGSFVRDHRPVRRPTTPLERRLAEIWAWELNLSRVGLDDNFFDLGGNSLTAMRVVTRAKEVGIALHAKELFAHQTLGRLVDALSHDGRSDSASIASSPLPPLRRRTGTAPVRATATQVSMIERCLDGARLNMTSAIEVSGSVDEAALSGAFARCLEKHPILRTHFRRAGEELVQVVEATADRFELEVRDLTRLDAETQLARIEDIKHHYFSTHFDLFRDLLFKACLLRLSDSSSLLLLVIHHSVFDGVSIQVLVDELGQAYAAALEWRGADLPGHPVAETPALDFLDFAQWEADFLDSARGRRELDEWVRHFEGVPGHLFYRHHPGLRTERLPNPVWQGSLRADVVARVDVFRRRHQLVSNMAVLQAAFLEVLSDYTVERDFLVSTTVTGRFMPEVERAIGPFFRHMGLRVAVTPDRDFAEACRKVGAELNRVIANPSISLARVLREMNKTRPEEPVRPCLTFRMGIESEALDEGFSLGEARAALIPDLVAEARDTSLGVMIVPRRGAYRIFVSYNPILLNPDMVEEIMARFKQRLIEETAKI